MFVVILRTFTNAFVILTLTGGGVAIFYAVQFSSSQQLMLVGHVVPFSRHPKLKASRSPPLVCDHCMFCVSLMQEVLPFDLGALLSPAVIFVLNVALPFIYDFIARYEKYKTQSGAIKMTLLR